MSNGSRVESLFASKGETVSFGERFQASEQFDRVFSEGMALVERSAAYLDGDGRRESKGSPATSPFFTPPRACASRRACSSSPRGCSSAGR